MNILIKPIITEKTTVLAQGGKYTLKVEKDANKNQIRSVLKQNFNVDAIEIKTIIVKGKKVRVGRTRQMKTGSDWKKAMITLKAGQKLDLFDVQGGPNA